MKLYYDEILFGEILTNHSMSIVDAIDVLGINLDKLAHEHNWDDWDWESLRIEA